MERRLTTILSADVVGYSRLIRADEAGTLAALKTHRKELIAPKAAQYHGRTIKLMGDGALMEFASVVEAVSFAVEVQCAMRARNAEVPAGRRIEFRIGINVGDIVVEGDDIYGDGVNIAARLEGLAEPGGICVRRNVHNQVHDKLDLSFEDLGDVEVKNIAQPIRAYRVVLDNKAEQLVTPVAAQPAVRSASRRIVAAGVAGFVILAGLAWWQPWSEPDVEPASVDQMAFPLPDKPSIAVLPFRSLGESQEQEELPRGLTENIISALARHPDLFVISDSARGFADAETQSLSAISEQLSVRYVLEGSVQSSEDRVRVTTRMSDALAGAVVWSERYDRELADIFEILDDIALKVLVALDIELISGQEARTLSTGTSSIEAWSLILQAEREYRGFTKAGMARSRELAQQALQVDPKYGVPWIVIGFTHLQDARFGYSSSPQRSLKAANDAAARAEAIMPDSPELHLLKCSLEIDAGNHGRAAEECRKAIEKSPNTATYYAALGWVQHFAGLHQKAVENLRLAKRLAPFHPTWYLLIEGRSLTFLGRAEDALEVHELGLQAAESNFMRAAHLISRAFAYYELGDLPLAKGEIRKSLESAPYLTVSFYEDLTYHRDPREWERFASALRAAGLPD